MPTITTPHHESTLAAEEEFLAILCSNEDLVRVEFDAIIAAEWPSLPPDPPEHDDAVEPSPGTARHQPTDARVRPSNRPRRPGIGGWARERSPPPRDTRK